MEEPEGRFPFHKLRFYKFVISDIMMYVEYPEIFKFMFTINKLARSFLETKFISVQNCFINEGLIFYDFYISRS